MRHKGPYQIRRRSAAFWLLAALFGCGRSHRAQIPVPASVDAGKVVALAADAGPLPLPEVTLVALWDGGSADLLSPDASMPPGAILRLETKVALDDFRVRLLDGDDRLVDGQTLLRIGDGITRADILPRGGLPTFRCCRLTLDGQVGLLPSAAHRSFQPWQAAITVEPDPNARPARSGSPARHHRRHRRAGRRPEALAAP
jgi:hypothetical protein